MERRPWSPNELLVALDLYCRIPYSGIHARNEEIQNVAKHLGRTPSALAMKLSNFAAFDPIHQLRGIKGLKNGAKADEILMHEFLLNPEDTIRAASEAFQTLGIDKEIELSSPSEAELLFPLGPTETTRTVQVRLTQRFFRGVVLSSYDFQCAFCALSIPELLNASHIVPWKVNENLRSNPRNGLALCAIHDRAFDRGLVSIDESSRIVLSSQLKEHIGNNMFDTAFNKIKGEPVRVPRRFAPEPENLTYHRDHIFRN